MNIVEVIFRGVDELSRETKKMSAGMQLAGETAKMATGFIAGFFAVGRIVQFAKAAIDASDAIQEMNEVLAQFLPNLEAVEETQKRIAELAIATDTTYSQTFELYARLLMANERLRLSDEERLRVVEAINMAQELAGPLASDISASFQRMLITGEVSGRSLIQVFSRAPRIMKALADDLGIAEDKLKMMGESGLLTIERLTEALINQSQAIREDYSKTGQTVAESWTNIKTAMGQAAFEFDELTGLSKNIADGLQRDALWARDFAGGLKAIRDAMKDDTAVDIVNDKAVANGEKINELLQREFRLREMIAKGKGEEVIGFGLFPDWDTAQNHLKETQEELKKLRAEADNLQSAMREVLRVQTEVQKKSELDILTEEHKSKLLSQVAAESLDPNVSTMLDNLIADLAIARQSVADETARLVDATVSDIAVHSQEQAAKVEETVVALERQKETIGKTAIEVELLKLKWAGAGDEMVKRAEAALLAIQRLKAELEQPGVDTLSFEGEEGPTREVALSLDEMADASSAAWAAMGRDAGKAAEDTTLAWDQATRNVQSLISEQLLSGFEDGAKGILKSFANMLKQMVAQALSANLTQAMFGGSAGGQNWFSAMFSTIGGAAAGAGGSGVAAGRATGGWTEPGMLHPVNEREPEFLMTAGRDRVVPLSKMAANGLPSGGNTFAPQTTLNVTSAISPFEFEAMLRRRDDMLMARWKQMTMDGAMT